MRQQNATPEVSLKRPLLRLSTSLGRTTTCHPTILTTGDFALFDPVYHGKGDGTIRNPTLGFFIQSAYVPTSQHQDQGSAGRTMFAVREVEDELDKRINILSRLFTDSAATHFSKISNTKLEELSKLGKEDEVDVTRVLPYCSALSQIYGTEIEGMIASCSKRMGWICSKGTSLNPNLTKIQVHPVDRATFDKVVLDGTPLSPDMQLKRGTETEDGIGYLIHDNQDFGKFPIVWVQAFGTGRQLASRGMGARDLNGDAVWANGESVGPSLEHDLKL